MATGVPKKRRKGEPRWQSRGITADTAAPMHLEYAGKAADGGCSAQRPSEVARLWPHGGQCGENRLYFGDNAGILAALLRDKEVLGKVRLVYIDPPFATQTMFHSRKLDHAYEDTLSGAEFVESLRKRLVILPQVNGGEMVPSTFILMKK